MDLAREEIPLQKNNIKVYLIILVHLKVTNYFQKNSDSKYFYLLWAMLFSFHLLFILQPSLELDLLSYFMVVLILLLLLG